MLLFSYFLFINGDFTHHFVYTVSLILLISGALGNLIDRLLRGAVVDFIDLHLFGTDLPVFNLADLMLFLGIIGFTITELL